jgi:hypothetical protein
VYFTCPFVLGRASHAAILAGDQGAFEAWTPLTADSNVSHPVVAGWAFRAGANVFFPADEAALIARGVLPASGAYMQPVWDGPGPAPLGEGAVNWNPHLGLWVLVSEGGGPGLGSGLQWVSTAAAMTGPWQRAWVVANHSDSGLSCYNTSPTPHLDDPSTGRVTFACTITAMWSNVYDTDGPWSTCLFKLGARAAGCAATVPRYEYNNMVYAVDVGRLLAGAGLGGGPPRGGGAGGGGRG